MAWGGYLPLKKPDLATTAVGFSIVCHRHFCPPMRDFTRFGYTARSLDQSLRLCNAYDHTRLPPHGQLSELYRGRDFDIKAELWKSRVVFFFSSVVEGSPQLPTCTSFVLLGWTFGVLRLREDFSLPIGSLIVIPKYVPHVSDIFFCFCNIF